MYAKKCDMKFSLQQLNWPNYFPSQDSISMIIHTFILAVNYLFKAFTHFCFHFDWNIISHNLNDQVCAIIIAHHKMDDQICAIERVDIYRQPLSASKICLPNSDVHWSANDEWLELKKTWEDLWLWASHWPLEWVIWGYKSWGFKCFNCCNNSLICHR